jgi:tol-pal system protein YbgF
MRPLALRPVLHACLVVAVAAGLAMAPAVPRAGLFEDDEAREAILKLREQRTQDQAADEARQQAQSEQIDRLGRSLLDMNARLDTLLAEVARLRGQNEVLAKTVADLQQTQKDMQRGVEERVRKLEPKEISLDGKTFKAEPDEAALFEQALLVLRDADFAGAVSKFQSLLKQYPNTGYRETALYWLGNAHYGLRACKPAMQSFKDLLSVNAKHLRAPEAMLAMANCHSELKEPRQAKTVLQALVKNHPTSEAAQVARERLAADTPQKK